MENPLTVNLSSHAPEPSFGGQRPLAPKGRPGSSAIMKRLLIFGWLLAAVPLPAGEWVELFDGRTLEGWQTAAGLPVTQGWEVSDGTIHRSGRGGDIVTSRGFRDFELEFEWKVAPGANSGLKYRFASYGEGGPVGVEYQVLDDSRHADGRNSRTSAASIYHVVAPAADKPLKPPGEWNSARIVARGSRLEHWLNGQKVASADLQSEEWRAALQQSKFRGKPDFGTRAGRILLQDHGDEVWFRNLRLRELAAEEGSAEGANPAGS